MPAQLPEGVVLLQSWQLAQPAAAGAAGEVVLCVAGGGRSTAAGDHSVAAAGSCKALQQDGVASFHRNESLAWAEAGAGRVPLFAYRPEAGSCNQTVILARAGDFPDAQRVSATPAVFVAAASPQPGAWPLLLWNASRAPSAAAAAAQGRRPASRREAEATAAAPLRALAPAPAPLWRVTGGPGSDQEVEQAQDSEGKIWGRGATLGWAMPLPSACYWGLPSVAFDDPAFASPGGFVYWRGNAWAPLAMLTYWSLDHEAYRDVAAVQVARKGLANSYAKMWMETAWRPSRQVCENFCVHEQGGCCGDSFYHWGALAGFMSILEAGK